MCECHICCERIGRYTCITCHLSFCANCGYHSCTECKIKCCNCGTLKRVFHSNVCKLCKKGNVAVFCEDCRTMSFCNCCIKCGNMIKRCSFCKKVLCDKCKRNDQKMQIAIMSREFTSLMIL